MFYNFFVFVFLSLCGQAYSLVEPDEIPHMLDLHLFLGRKPSNVFTRRGGDDGNCPPDSGGVAEEEGDGGKREAMEGYEVSELRPDLVHYGNFPQQASLSLRLDGDWSGGA